MTRAEQLVKRSLAAAAPFIAISLATSLLLLGKPHIPQISAECKKTFCRKLLYFLRQLLASCNNVAYTKVEVFVDKEVREAAPDGEGKCARWRDIKARDFTNFLIHKSTLLSMCSLRVKPYLS